MVCVNKEEKFPFQNSSDFILQCQYSFYSSTWNLNKFWPNPRIIGQWRARALCAKMHKRSVCELPVLLWHLGALTPALGQPEQPRGVGTGHCCSSGPRDGSGSFTFTTGPFVPKPQCSQMYSAAAAPCTRRSDRPQHWHCHSHTAAAGSQGLPQHCCQVVHIKWTN